MSMESALYDGTYYIIALLDNWKLSCDGHFMHIFIRSECQFNVQYSHEHFV